MPHEGLWLSAQGQSPPWLPEPQLPWDPAELALLMGALRVGLYLQPPEARCQVDPSLNHSHSKSSAGLLPFCPLYLGSNVCFCMYVREWLRLFFRKPDTVPFPCHSDHWWGDSGSLACTTPTSSSLTQAGARIVEACPTGRHCTPGVRVSVSIKNNTTEQVTLTCGKRHGLREGGHWLPRGLSFNLSVQQTSNPTPQLESGAWS